MAASTDSNRRKIAISSASSVAARSLSIRCALLAFAARSLSLPARELCCESARGATMSLVFGTSK